MTLTLLSSSVAKHIHNRQWRSEASSIDTGWSATIKEGLVISARAIATRCACPQKARWITPGDFRQRQANFAQHVTYLYRGISFLSATILSFLAVS